jgi:hypothetical protein
MWSVMIGPMRRSLFQLLYSLVHLLLHQQELAQYVGLRCQKCLCRCQGWWQGWVTTTWGTKTIGSVVCRSDHLKIWVFIKHTLISLLIKLTSRICMTKAHLS